MKSLCAVILVSASSASLQLSRKSAEPGSASSDGLPSPSADYVVTPTLLSRVPRVVMADKYLRVMRETLTGTALATPEVEPFRTGDAAIQGAYNSTNRRFGINWCSYCMTMAGEKNLEIVEMLLLAAAANGAKGDFLETGVWRGGTSLYARAVQTAYSLPGHVFLADSFEGLPPRTVDLRKTGVHNFNEDSAWSDMSFLKVTTAQVTQNFESFHLMSPNVHMVKGYFQHSLPPLRQQFQQEKRSLSVLRGDGDMYESYFDILFNMYEFVPVGGYFICDDCPSIEEAMVACADFRYLHNISDADSPWEGKYESSTNLPLWRQNGWYWRKTADVAVNYDYYLKWNATRTKPTVAHVA